MVHSKLINNIQSLDAYQETVKTLCAKSNADMPFNYLELPFIWWKNFSSSEDSDFGIRRGRNFWGRKSWVKDFKLLLTFEEKSVIGITPFTEIHATMSGRSNTVKMLTFTGDSVLIAYQDFLVDTSKRSEALSSAFSTLKTVTESDFDILFLGYIPESSLNLPILNELLQQTLKENWRGGVVKNQRRGGIYPWTFGRIIYHLSNLEKKMQEENVDSHSLSSLLKKFSSVNTGFLHFKQTRVNLEKELNNCLKTIPAVDKYFQSVSEIRKLVNHENISYPEIKLPGDRDTYLSSLSKETRRYFRRYGKRFEEAGGRFEKIVSADITDNDIHDFLNLHAERWKNESAAVSDKTINFHNELIRQLSKHGNYTLFFATYQGRRIASHACLDYAFRREAYFNGRDPAYEELRAGRLLYFETILDAIGKKFKVYDCGYGGDDYKLSFANKLNNTSNVVLIPAGKSIDLNSLFPNFEYIGL